MTKIAIAQMNVRAARPDINLRTMQDFCRRAAAEGADLLIFPELAVTGSFLGQYWTSQGLLQECQKANEKLIAGTANLGDMAIVFGSIGLVKTPDGSHSPASAIYVAQHGKQISSPAADFQLTVNGSPLHFGLLTDGQTIGAAPILLRLATSCFVHDKTPLFWQDFANFTKSTGKTLIYANHVGVQDAGKPVYVYDGGSAVFAPDGSMIGVAQQFSEELLIVDTANASPIEIPQNDTTEVLYNGIVAAIRDYSANLGIEKVTIGLSGGIDSCLNACLFTAALGKENVLGINMPSRYNCDATREIAAKLAENLGIRYIELPIQQAVDNTAEQLAGAGLLLSDTMLENVQSRQRGAVLLAAAAAAFGGAATCNSNKSELTVGYATMYGDTTGYFAPLGDLWKCQVYELARHIYQTSGLIPLAALEITPSAELSDAQSIEQGLGDPLTYAYHDYLFRSWVEWGQDISDTLAFYNDGKLPEVIGCGHQQLRELFPTTLDFIKDCEHWWQLFRGLGAAKRLQVPPVLSLSRRAFGSDMPESQTGVYFDSEYRLQKARMLAKADNLI